jgi:hypothetical protein
LLGCGEMVAVRQRFTSRQDADGFSQAPTSPS